MEIGCRSLATIIGLKTNRNEFVGMNKHKSPNSLSTITVTSMNVVIIHFTLPIVVEFTCSSAMGKTRQACTKSHTKRVTDVRETTQLEWKKTRRKSSQEKTAVPVRGALTVFGKPRGVAVGTRFWPSLIDASNLILACHPV
jgi:hypothetical protein